MVSRRRTVKVCIWVCPSSSNPVSSNTYFVYLIRTCMCGLVYLYCMCVFDVHMSVLHMSQ